MTSEDEIRKYFEKKLMSSGHTLENKTQKILIKSFEGLVQREVPYVDIDSNKGRTIDFIATYNSLQERLDSKSDLTGHLELIVECKKLPDHAWLFEGDVFGGYSFPDFALSMETSDKIRIPEIPYLKHVLFQADSYFEDIMINKEDKKKTKSNGKTNNIYTAIMQTIKATRYKKDSINQSYESRKNKFKLPPEWYVFQPLIVFEGRMYSASYDDEIKLKPIEFASIRKNYISEHYHETFGEIHIVSINWLEKYLEVLKSSYSYYE